MGSRGALLVSSVYPDGTVLSNAPAEAETSRHLSDGTSNTILSIVLSNDRTDSGAGIRRTVWFLPRELRTGAEQVFESVVENQLETFSGMDSGPEVGPSGIIAILIGLVQRPDPTGEDAAFVLSFDGKGNDIITEEAMFRVLDDVTVWRTDYDNASQIHDLEPEEPLYCFHGDRPLEFLVIVGQRKRA